jgi:hypothetical protein
MNCPKCKSKDKLYINKTTGQFICFRCGEDKGFRGRPEFALHELSGLPLSVIRATIYGTGTVDNSVFLNLSFGDFLEDDELIPDETAILQELMHPWDHHDLDHPFSKNGVKYLETRGIDLALAKKYSVMYSPTRRSIVFPVEIGTKLVGWQYRIIDPEIEVVDEIVFHRIKSINSKNFPRGQAVMFANQLVGDTCVLAEGPIDAIHADLVGGNVASLGKEINIGQVQMIINAGIKKVYLALDPDAASTIDSVLQKFGDNIEVYKVKLPDKYKDLGEMPLDEAKGAILNSEKLIRGQMHLYFRDYSRK